MISVDIAILYVLFAPLSRFKKYLIFKTYKVIFPL